jgi:hypothetical protein
MTRWPRDALNQSRKHADLSHSDLFLRYFELGGMSGAFELEALCHEALQPGAHDYDVVAHALNERSSELRQNHLVAYTDDRQEDIP